jgi:hypothetical protein
MNEFGFGFLELHALLRAPPGNLAASLIVRMKPTTYKVERLWSKRINAGAG